MSRASRRAAAAWLGVSTLALAVAGCAPIAQYRGVAPAPGAVTVFARDASAAAPIDAWSRLELGSTSLARRSIGTLPLPADRDSFVVGLYGDNRPGLRLVTTPWGAMPALRGMRTTDPLAWTWAILNLPIVAVQGFIPTLDGFQDALTLFVTHHPHGGAEKRVLKALEAIQPLDLVVNTGDLVEDGRRGRQWEEFVSRHTAIRRRVPYLGTVGNHEAAYDDVSARNWDAVMGVAPEHGRYWYSLDLAGGLARFVVLDSNLFCDPRNRYPDSLRDALGAAQLAWADSALAAPVRWKFLVFHHPLASSGHYLKDWNRTDRRPLAPREKLVEMCRRHEVTALLAGHEHLFHLAWLRYGQTRDGLWQVTTGGAGSPLVQIPQQRRERSQKQSIPGMQSRVHFVGTERSVYHLCRLVIRHGARPEQQGVVLYVDRVDARGHRHTIEVHRLDQPPEVL